MKEQRFRELFEAWLSQRLEPADEGDWWTLLADPGLDAIRGQLIDAAYDELEQRFALEPEAAEALYRRIRRPEPARRGRVLAMRWLRVAVAVIVLLGPVGAWWWQQHRTGAPPAPAAIAAAPRDLPPGGNKAVLILADGTQVVLDSAINGTLAQQGGTKVIKVNDGQLAYRGIAGKPDVILYNTVRTPKGGQYKLILPDGSRVWLNAGSSLTFPTAFTDSIRSVTLTGEGYFEVAANRTAPFVVRVGGSSIEVLGTHFDVFAYAEDFVEKTTLLQGAIKVSYGTRSALLRPGQQAGVDAKTGLTVREDVDTTQAVAWKNGMFSFDHKDLYAAMREIARWYNVEIIYERKVPDKVLVGYVHRDTKLSIMLNALRMIGVHCRMEGRTVYVSP